MSQLNTSSETKKAIDVLTNMMFRGPTMANGEKAHLVEEEQRAVRIAIGALHRHLPVEAEKTKAGAYRCPTCCEEYVGNTDTKFYCLECGQALSVKEDYTE